MTGRAPKAGVYLSENRVPRHEVCVDLPDAFDDSIWPMLGWLVGKFSPNKIPLVTGLEHTSLTVDDLKALCAAFGTTSAAPMMHINGHTPGDKLAEPLHLEKFARLIKTVPFQIQWWIALFLQRAHWNLSWSRD